MAGRSWSKELMSSESFLNVKLIKKCKEDKDLPTSTDFNSLLKNLENATPGVLCLLFISPDCYASQKLVHQFNNLLLQLSRRKSVEENSSNGYQKESRSTNSPSAIRKFFNNSSKKSREKLDSPPAQNQAENLGRGIEVVVINMGKMATELDCARDLLDFIPNDWHILEANETKVKSQLLRCSRTLSVPCLTLVDAPSGKIIRNDAKRDLLEDLDGKCFPWWCPSPSTVFTGDLLSHRPEDERNLVKWENLQSIKAIFFGANWCPPCRVFLPILRDRYEKLKQSGQNFDIIFVSSDRSQSSFDQFFGQMPWLALPFADQKADVLSRYFNVNGIPALLVLDEQNRLISRHARNEVLADSMCMDFPWYPRKVLELNEYTSGRLKDELSFILFTEGSPEDAHFASVLLSYICDQCEQPATKTNPDLVLPSRDQMKTNGCDQNGNQEMNDVNQPKGDAVNQPKVGSDISEPIQFVHAGDNDVVDQLMETLEIHVYWDLPLPLLILLDVFNESFYICEEPDVSQQVAHQFLLDALNDKIQPRPIPTNNTAVSSPAHVGGIPMNAISAALGMSPSTVCMGPSSNRPAETV